MRNSGVLLHITSLPSRGGIGTLGQAAYDFIDFVRDSGMNIWQVLPLGPTGYAESPYQSASTFAGNPLMIDFDLLEADGLLPAGAYEPLPWREEIDFEAVKAQKSALLRLSFDRSFDGLRDRIAEFEAARAWVRGYALFRAVKAGFGEVSWMEWPDQDIRLRKPEAVAKYEAALAREIDYYIYEQYLFFDQWTRLHDYARQSGVELMGDMPIYVAEDSADVWLNPELFELDEDCRPIRIAGVPPDYFQADGQRWGNPLYNWPRHQETKYAWWLSRLKETGALVDILRIDHFIGFANYYAIPASEPTARNGKYELGPGRKLFNRIKKALPEMKIVAEDLGVQNRRVRRLLDYAGYPGMKVLQFAFDSDESPDLPANHTANCVVYTGTHDNNTTLGWWSAASEETKARARKALGMPERSEDVMPYILCAAFCSVADTAIVPMQDWLDLDAECRMNFPGTVGGNWLWRMAPNPDYRAVACHIRKLNRMSRRGTLTHATPEELIRMAGDFCMLDSHVPLDEALPYELHDAVAKAAMMDIAPQWEDDYQVTAAHRRAAYLSAEYLMGRAVYNNLYNMGVLEPVKALLAGKGIDLADLEDIEDAALGNGGLGRLAACFLDSAAAHDIPLTGYGLRYRYGLFAQVFDETGAQIELPDDWSADTDPWSVRRDDRTQLVCMEGLTVYAVPYDMPVIGYDRRSIGTLRLWQCEAVDEFDLNSFNDQDYAAACREKNLAEDITKVLYPNDTLDAGKLMRLRQQYVLVSASLQDMLDDFCQHHADILARDGYAGFADLYAVQLNDTHPAMAIPELIRLLTEEAFAGDAVGSLSFGEAFDIARRTFRYTNHTVMREALECWDLRLLSKLSKDLVRVIKKIQARLSRELKRAKVAEPGAMAIIDENKRVHMANLSVYGSSYTNGVAAIHSQILKDDVFREWYALYPERFNNKTNGITQRRWLGLCNPELTALLKARLGGDAFLTDLYALEALRPMIGDETLVKDFIAVKQEKKRQLSALIAEREGIDIPEHFVFDVQVKRLHEYKRQLMNALSILDIYWRIKDGELADLPPVAFIFGAKSAPGYRRAKAVIRFINHIARLVNNDPDVADRLRVAFVQNYNCSYAEHIIPAADISEQISPAGTEASGTGNMKLMLNGAVTLGTYDGANIEIFEQAGIENNFVFGAKVDELNAIRDDYDPNVIYEADPRLQRAIDALGDGTFEPADAPMEEGQLVELKKALLEGASWHKPDHYFVLKDYASYLEAKLTAIRATADAGAFAEKCLNNIAGAGKFSSDRTILQYWNELWG